MVVTQTGSRTVSVQRLVEEGCKHEKERALIHHLPMAELTAGDWDPTTLPGNATIRSVKAQAVQALSMNHTRKTIWHLIIIIKV